MGKRRAGRRAERAEKVSPSLKREGDPRGHQAIHRLTNGGLRALGLDSRLASEVWKLGICGEITDVQREACLKVGDIYERWYRLHKLHPDAKSGSFEQGIRSHDSIGELFDPDAELSDAQRDHRDSVEVKAHRDEEQWRLLQQCLHKLPGRGLLIPELVHQLCVRNEPIGNAQLQLILPTIDLIATVFKIRDGSRAPTSIAITSSKRALPTKPKPSERRAFYASVATVVLGLNEEERRQKATEDLLEQAFKRYLTERDREWYRVERKAGRLKAGQ